MHINKFSDFLNENKNSIEYLKKMANYSGQYIDFNILPNGNLNITLTENGYIELVEGTPFEDLIDDIRGNSSWVYVDDLGDYGFMTNAPAMLFQYDTDEEGRISVNIYEEGEIFYYSQYEYDFINKLKIDKSITFRRINVSPEEQYEYDLNKDAEPYNL